MCFFPCGHKCVCGGCVAQHRLTESGATTLGDGQDMWCFCPLCNDEIKRMAVPVPGKEAEAELAYWAWVNEVRPVLPSGFVEKLRKASNGLVDTDGGASEGSGDSPRAAKRAGKSGVCAVS